jgi:mono/diheme cytochrome c family protein
MPSIVRTLTLLLAFGSLVIRPTSATQSSNSDLERRFDQTVRPFLAQHCMGCHGTATPAAQFDMRPYSTMAGVLEDFGHWLVVNDRLKAGEMPPKAAPQPSAAVRQQVIDWIRDVRADQARRHAGDPGPVLARRLSNAEYDNTIRDLTGVDLRPAREFPVDPANTSGFDNSGESLAMSPALLNKYLQAARLVGDHMVLTPDGFDFAAHPMLVETDRDRYAIQRILDFYKRQPTDYADYFQAAWRYKHRVALRQPRATLETVAAESKVSAKYLRTVWQLLEEKENPATPAVGPVAKLQAMWRALTPPTAKQPDLPRDQTVAMRDFVIKIRSHSAMQFAAPIVRGLPPGSQPLLNWKLRAFNLHRNEFDPKALRNDTDVPPAPPAIPRYPGLHQEAAPRWAALTARARLGDPDLVVPAAERSRYEASFARFASVFPDVFYVTERGRYFPDDSDDKGRFLSAGYHNVMGYWRDDVPLRELVLDEKGQKQLDRLWDEFDFIARHTERTWDQFYFNQSGAVDGKGAEAGRLRPPDKAVTDTEVIFGLMNDFVAKALADQRNDPVAPEAIRFHFQRINDTLRSMERMRVEAEPHHLNALLRFAERAYRRPLSQPEGDDLLKYYNTLRKSDELSHEEAMRDSIVSILMSPKFSYRIDMVEGQPGKTAKPAKYLPLSPHALACRLSYFLWASMPDEELLAAAASGKLLKTEVLVAQTRRMLKDPRARGMAIEFGGNWLDFRRFEEHNAVDRQRFPGFTNELRQAMFEEPVRLLEDVIRNDRSVLDLVYGNYTFVNPILAKHYGMPEVTGDSDHWVRVDDARLYGRGSLLTMSAFLTQNAPGLRTSPVKRGYWVVRRLLGETIPPPPPSVPELPKDEAKLDLPLRDVLAKHRENAACASCHARFDSFGLAFEDYGPTGERRTMDLAGRPVETEAVFPNGTKGSGYEGVQDFIRQHRQKDFVDNLSRKLMAYGLGRSPLLSDDEIIDRMKAQSSGNGSRFSSLVVSIVTSPQFLNRRAPENER